MWRLTSVWPVYSNNRKKNRLRSFSRTTCIGRSKIMWRINSHCPSQNRWPASLLRYCDPKRFLFFHLNFLISSSTFSFQVLVVLTTSTLYSMHFFAHLLSSFRFTIARNSTISSSPSLFLNSVLGNLISHFHTGHPSNNSYRCPG